MTTSIVTPEKSVLKTPQFWLGILVSIGCFAYIFTKVSPLEIWDGLKNTNPILVVICLSIQVLYLTFRAIRWRALLNDDIPLKTVFHAQHIGFMLTQLLPLRLGDPARALIVGSQKPVTISRGLSTLIVERLLDLLMVLILLPIALLQLSSMPDELKPVVALFSVATFVGLVGLIAMANFKQKVLTILENKLSPSIIIKVDEVLTGFSIFTTVRSTIKILILSALPWLTYAVAFWIMLTAVGIETNYLIAVFILCCTSLGVALPSAPAGVGLFHGIAISMLTFALGNSIEAEATTFAFLFHALNMLLLILMGVIGLFFTEFKLSEIIDTTKNMIRKNNN